MPELPEVEHVARYLAERIVGQSIRNVRLLDPTARRRPCHDPRRRLEQLEGARVTGVERRAKLLFLLLEPRKGPAVALAFHLKLTGKLWAEPASVPATRWVRLVLELSSGTEVRFEDTRRLGWFDIVDEAGRASLEADLGPEPLEPGFTRAVLKGRLARRRGAIKPILLDPAFVAGIGNIYADEILHAARIHPLERAEQLTPRAVGRLHAAIVSILARAVRERTGVPNRERVGQGSRTASRALRLAVFQRTGQPCPRCRTTIERLVVRTRGTHVCPRCQPPPGGAPRQYRVREVPRGSRARIRRGVGTPRPRHETG
jgi:formamidopyrimidine-DNA glycosylase